MKRIIDEYGTDAAILTGLIMVGKGLYMVFPPSMWVVCGCGLIYLGWPKVVKK